MNAEKQESTYATGKRKTAVARVWVKAGSGQIQVNGVPGDSYFERETSRMIMRQSLELIEVLDQYDITATVAGGGHSAQADAMLVNTPAIKPSTINQMRSDRFCLLSSRYNAPLAFRNTLSSFGSSDPVELIP